MYGISGGNCTNSNSQHRRTPSNLSSSSSVVAGGSVSKVNPSFRLEDELDTLVQHHGTSTSSGNQRMACGLDPCSTAYIGTHNAPALYRHSPGRQNSFEMERPEILVGPSWLSIQQK